MGKSILVKGGNFGVNGIPLVEPLSVAWMANGFIYDSDSKGYSDSNYAMRAYRLNAGNTYKISTTVADNTTLSYAQVNVATSSDASLQEPTLTQNGVSLGTITKIVQTKANIAIAPVNRTLTVESDCTLLVTTRKNDSCYVFLEQ